MLVLFVCDGKVHVAASIKFKYPVNALMFSLTANWNRENSFPVGQVYESAAIFF